LRPTQPPARAAQLGFVTAVALADAIRVLDADAHAVTCKWPNDLLLDGAKLAGILLEAEGVRSDAIEALIIGVGVNLAWHPDDTEFPAAHLALPGGAAALLAVFVQRFEAWSRRWEREGFTCIRDAWRAQAYGLGAPIRVRLPDRVLHGRFVELDAEGLLLLDDGEQMRRISAGDVFFAPHA
jgi:BirA family biotin operon repressor/biotin-[acetyl-CoA-carboxylase] ligase